MDRGSVVVRNKIHSCSTEMTIALGIALLFLLIVAGIYAYGRFGHRDKGTTSYALPIDDHATALDRSVDELLKANGEKCGVLLSSSGQHAFAARALSARGAQRSLDLQYYYWKDDATGILLAGEILTAADRGVRVRLQLDDINLRGKDATYLSLDCHPNVEVRVFNPCWNRTGALQRGFELLIRAYSATRRMHNKAWIADGRIAIVGGRNIGDAYFDASSQTNFQDLDAVIIGREVQAVERIFDRFWNSDCVVPLRSLPGLEAGDIVRLRDRFAEARASDPAQLIYKRTEDFQSINRLLKEGKLHWTDKIRAVSDPPAKLDAKLKHQWLYREIIPLILSATKSVKIISPYFVPGKKGLEQLLALAERGVEVSILTNSLAATDVAAVHGGYSRYRQSLVRSGINIHELKAEPRRQRISAFGSKGASLHTKTFLVDDRFGFVGSFNFDPRSVSLNTEMGVFFDDLDLAEEFAELFKRQTSPKASYRLATADNRIIWFDGATSTTEPGANAARRVLAKLFQYLPVESQL